jgi:hypothetical protein
MTKVIKAIVPPTKEQGSCCLLGTSSLLETFKQNVLWQYNKMREHDGFSPVKRMPRGTKYTYKPYLGAIV